MRPGCGLARRHTVTARGAPGAPGRRNARRPPAASSGTASQGQPDTTLPCIKRSTFQSQRQQPSYLKERENGRALKGGSRREEMQC